MDITGQLNRNLPQFQLGPGAPPPAPNPVTAAPVQPLAAAAPPTTLPGQVSPYWQNQYPNLAPGQPAQGPLVGSMAYNPIPYIPRV